MSAEDDPTVTEAITHQLHPVKFGYKERKVLIVILILGVANLLAALFLVMEAVWF